MKFGVKIIKNKVILETYDKSQENYYADVIVDKYFYTRDLSDQRTIKMIKNAEKEFAYYIRQKSDIIEYIKSGLNNITDIHLTEPKVKIDGGITYVVYDKDDIIHYLKVNNVTTKLNIYENHKYNICGYINYISVGKEGIFYKISKGYSDFHCLFFRPLGSEGLDKDVFIDCDVLDYEIFDGKVYYTKARTEKYFVGDDIYVYDIYYKKKRMLLKIKNVSGFTTIKSKKVLIFTKDDDKSSMRSKSMYYIDARTNRIYPIFENRIINLDFTATPDGDFLVIVSKDDKYNIFVLDWEKFINKRFMENYVNLVFDKNECYLHSYAINKKYVSFIVGDIVANKVYLLIYDKFDTSKLLYKKELKGENFSIYDSGYYDDNEIVISYFVDHKKNYEKINLNENKIQKKSHSMYNVNFDDYTVEKVNMNGVPTTVIRRKSLEKPKGVLLNVYGSYGISLDYEPNMLDIFLLEHDFMVVYSHVRGGGEKGKKHHEEGKKLKKMNSIMDNISVTEYIYEKILEKENKIVMYGRSAAGLVLGGCMNMRPELYAGVIFEMAFVQPILSLLDETLALTESDKDEFGDPKDPVYYYYMKQYDPYLNVKPKSYPNVLIISGLEDERVLVYEGLSMYKKIKEMRMNKSGLTFHHIRNTGHFIESNESVMKEYYATLIAFMMDSVGYKI
ncbi:MAG: prolyl oligopeptidase family serine peptidase [Candidatus Aenigmatarchaeota archaeon]